MLKYALHEMDFHEAASEMYVFVWPYYNI